MPARVMKRLLFLFLMGTAVTAQAHKVNVFAYAEGDQVYVEGYFSDGTRAKNSQVTVSDMQGRQLIQGTTNEEGDFIFPLKEREGLRITLNAGQGHQSLYEIPADEITGQVAHSPQSAASHQGDPNDESNAEGEASSVSEAMVRKAVAQGVLPLARQISELKERRGLSDIVGGIGLIMGALGIFGYFRAQHELRRLKSNQNAS